MVDQNERFRNRPIIFQREVFYGQLEYILECTIPAHSDTAPGCFFWPLSVAVSPEDATRLWNQ